MAADYYFVFRRYNCATCRGCGVVTHYAWADYWQQNGDEYLNPDEQYEWFVQQVTLAVRRKVSA